MLHGSQDAPAETRPLSRDNTRSGTQNTSGMRHLKHPSTPTYRRTYASYFLVLSGTYVPACLMPYGVSASSCFWSLGMAGEIGTDGAPNTLRTAAPHLLSPVLGKEVAASTAKLCFQGCQQLSQLRRLGTICGSVAYYVIQASLSPFNIRIVLLLQVVPRQVSSSRRSKGKKYMYGVPVDLSQASTRTVRKGGTRIKNDMAPFLLHVPSTEYK